MNSFEKYGLEDPPRSGRLPLISHKTLQKIEQEFKRISDGMTPKKLMQFIFYRTHIILLTCVICCTNGIKNQRFHKRYMCEQHPRIRAASGINASFYA